jgi:hypothetical protein
MATVRIPLLFKDLTGGDRRADVPGGTLEEIVAALDGLYPGMAAKMLDGNGFSPIVALTVDGKIASRGPATPVGPESEVCILPSFGGG